jgi:hypothetical protein
MVMQVNIIASEPKPQILMVIPPARQPIIAPHAVDKRLTMTSACLRLICFDFITILRLDEADEIAFAASPQPLSIHPRHRSSWISTV